MGFKAIFLSSKHLAQAKSQFCCVILCDSFYFKQKRRPPLKEVFFLKIVSCLGLLPKDDCIIHFQRKCSVAVINSLEL